jgi:hypothetical protein
LGFFFAGCSAGFRAIGLCGFGGVLSARSRHRWKRSCQPGSSEFGLRVVVDMMEREVTGGGPVHLELDIAHAAAALSSAWSWANQAIRGRRNPWERLG